MAATQPTLEPDIEPNSSRGRDRRQRERAAHAADDRQRPLDQPARDAAAPHDVAGKDEQRDRQQRKVVEAAEHRAHAPAPSSRCPWRRCRWTPPRSARRRSERRGRAGRPADRSEPGRPFGRVLAPGRGCLRRRRRSRPAGSKMRNSAITTIRRSEIGTTLCGIHIGTWSASLRWSNSNSRLTTLKACEHHRQREQRPAPGC